MVVGSVTAGVSQPPVIATSTVDIALGSTSTSFFCDFVGSVDSDIRVYVTHNEVMWNAPITQFDAPSGLAISFPAGYTSRRGSVYAVVSLKGVASNASTIGNFRDASIVLKNSNLAVARNSHGNRIELHGSGFGGDPTQVSVTTTPTLQSQSIHVCQDTLLIIDVADTTAVSGTVLSASVQRSTALGTITSNEATIGYLQSALQHKPVLSSSAEQMSQISADVLIKGNYFGAVANNIRVYLTSSMGTSALSQISLVDSKHIRVNFKNHTQVAGHILATASVKGVLSNTATIALQGQKSSLTPRPRHFESPIEGHHMIAVHGSNLKLSETVVCLWSGLPNTTGVVAGNGSAVFCPTPMGTQNTTSILSVRLASEIHQTGISIHVFATMLVSDIQSNSVLRFNADTGAYWDTFVLPSAGGLDGPWGTAFGPTKHLHVASANSGAVLMYHGSTGRFIKRFCTVPAPRGLVFHYGELYVCSSDDATIYRFNGVTGAARGILAASPLLQHAWSLVFDRFTNKSLVAGQYQQQIIQIDPPRVHTNSSRFNASRAHLWSSHKIHHITGLDMSNTHVYGISPYTNGIMQFNRTTGMFIQHFDKFMFQRETFDVKVYNSSVYSCGADGVQRYREFAPLHLLDHDAAFHKQHAGTRCTFLLVNSDFGALHGK